MYSLSGQSGKCLGGLKFICEEAEMMEIELTARWHEAFPGGHVGLLLVGNVDNRRRITALDTRKLEIEAELRSKYAGQSRAELQELEVLRAYREYYRRFDQTYHVQSQLESVVHKHKSLPNVSPLVDANFAAELQSLVLTAGHDADLLEAPVRIDATLGGEAFEQMNGATRTLKAHDMMMLDGSDIVCTILLGQDKRTAISEKTRRALYVAYAPTGVPVAAVQIQLELIRDYILLVAPEAEIEMLEVHAAGSVQSSALNSC
jgi:DNA/RNA-binding domain of Phe-tRNA-synthetase-like protein